MKKKEYEVPVTLRTQVELESGFMKASIFDPNDGHDEGLTIEVHDFANPGKEWEGDYSNSNWDW